MARKRPPAPPAEESVLTATMGLDAIKTIVRATVEEVLRNHERLAVMLPPERLAFPEAEAATCLGLHIWQLRDERLRGRIMPTRLVGRRIYYSREELIRYLESKTGI